MNYTQPLEDKQRTMSRSAERLAKEWIRDLKRESSILKVELVISIIWNIVITLTSFFV